MQHVSNFKLETMCAGASHIDEVDMEGEVTANGNSHGEGGDKDGAVADGEGAVTDDAPARSAKSRWAPQVILRITVCEV